MAKDGYWHPAEDGGFGYPMAEGGMGMYGVGANQDRVTFVGPGHYSARAGHEVQVLVRAANILARDGQQQTREDVLATTRGLYKTFLSDMQRGGKPMVDLPDWRERQITAAVPVTGANMSFRSDELIGTDVRSPNNVALGSVDDMVLSPETGKIAYLVIARGGYSVLTRAMFRCRGTISGPRPTAAFSFSTPPKARSTARRGSRMARFRSAATLMTKVKRSTPIGRRASRPRLATEGLGCRVRQVSAPGGLAAPSQSI
jgi:hypothetical protein